MVSTNFNAPPPPGPRQFENYPCVLNVRSGRYGRKMAQAHPGYFTVMVSEPDVRESYWHTQDVIDADGDHPRCPRGVIPQLYRANAMPGVGGKRKRTHRTKRSARGRRRARRSHTRKGRK